MDIEKTVAAQREYYNSGATRSLEFRLNGLSRLKKAVLENQPLIESALKTDLNKHPLEAYMCETGMVLDEIGYHIKHLPSWARDKRVMTPLAQFPSVSKICPEPYGPTLIMSPWNYPVQLCLEPLIGAISAGNCAIIKPSAYAPASSAAVKKLIDHAFPPEYVAVIEGGRAENSALLEQRFDYIFFTGSVAVGKEVMAAAAKNLTPVTLELGGKSPVIIDRTANLKTAARRVAFGKVINAGQTCVEPDYLLIHESVRDEFIVQYRAALAEFFPNGDMSQMANIINDKHFDRVVSLMAGENTIIGGGYDKAGRFVEPTVLVDITPDSPIMQQEIFGPILPVMTYSDLDQCVSLITSRPKPLALYLFTQDKNTEKRILSSCSFGGGCVNDTIIHLASPRLPFGGVGASGMGSYHGKKSFDTFTHYRSVVKKSTFLDLPMRYMPYSDKKLGTIKRFLK